MRQAIRSEAAEPRTAPPVDRSSLEEELVMGTILLIILIILICAALPTLPYRMHRTPGQFVPGIGNRRDASRGHNASVVGTRTQRTWLDRLKMRRPAYEPNLAGRYEGYHSFPNNTGSFEVFWRADGWWWWTRAADSPPKSEAVGPFVTSAEAYSNATMQRMTAND